MGWEAFLGALVPSLLILMAAAANWLKSDSAVREAKSAKDKAQEAVAKASAVEDKLDINTQITTRTGEAAASMQTHSEACNQEILRLSKESDSHRERIDALEAQVIALKISMENVDRSVSTTRHEFRGHFQTIMNKLDIMAAMPKAPERDK